MLITIIVVLLQLINIGSTTAFFAILSLNTLALYLSYLIPILFWIIHKLRGFPVPYGPFKVSSSLPYHTYFRVALSEVSCLSRRPSLCVLPPFPSMYLISSHLPVSSSIQRCLLSS